MAEELERQGIEVETIQIGQMKIQGCIRCMHCRTSEGNRCVNKDDIVNEVAAKMRAADGFILASPTYYAGIAGTMKDFLDRAFFSSVFHFKYKVGTSVAVVRRAGGVDVVHQLNNYLNLSQTVIAPSQYWTVGYGADSGEVISDEEGVQTLRRNAQYMAWLLKIIEETKDKIPHPADEPRVRMNFIR